MLLSPASASLQTTKSYFPFAKNKKKAEINATKMH
jgi:hypothetical protein